MDIINSVLRTLKPRHLAALLVFSAISGSAQYTFDWVSTDGNPYNMSASVEVAYPNSSLVPPDSFNLGVDELSVDVPGFGNFNYNPADGALTEAAWSPAGISDLFFGTDDPFGAFFTTDEIQEVNQFPTMKIYTDSGKWVLAAPDEAKTWVLLASSLAGLLLFRGRPVAKANTANGSMTA